MHESIHNILIALLTLAGLLEILAVVTVYKMLYPKRNSTQSTIDDELQKGEITHAFLKLPKTEFKVKSNYDYDISGFYIKGTTNKTIIFTHGIAWTRYGMVKYMDSFLEDGWNIVAYDHRGTGDSGGGLPSYGFFEKQDLDRVVYYVKEIFPDTSIFGLYGESMGAATALQYSHINPKFDFIVAICPFSSLRRLISGHLSRIGLPKIFHWFVLGSVRILMKLIAKFDIDDVHPAKDALTHKIPLFLAHGTRDEITPFTMSEELYERRKNLAPTTIFLGAGAGHTPAIYLEHRDKFEEDLWEFIDEVLVEPDHTPIEVIEEEPEPATTKPHPITPREPKSKKTAKKKPAASKKKH